MRWLLVLSRVAFICNIFFLVAFSLQLSNWIKEEQLTSTVVVIGYVMGFAINPTVNICYIFTALISKKALKIVPVWLIVANVLFLIVEAFYILYINSEVKHI
jgi:hypothetical protein